MDKHDLKIEFRFNLYKFSLKINMYILNCFVIFVFSFQYIC